MQGVSLTHPVMGFFIFFRGKRFVKVTLKREKETLQTLKGTEQHQTRTEWKMATCCCWEFILHILCWPLDAGSFYYTSCAWCFMWGVSITHPVFGALCGESLLHSLCWLPYVGSFSYMYCASFFMWRISLTQPMLPALCGIFLLHFHASFFMLVVSLTHPMLAV